MIDSSPGKWVRRKSTPAGLADSGLGESVSLSNSPKVLPPHHWTSTSRSRRHMSTAPAAIPMNAPNPFTSIGAVWLAGVPTHRARGGGGGAGPPSLSAARRGQRQRDARDAGEGGAGVRRVAAAAAHALSNYSTCSTPRAQSRMRRCPRRKSMPSSPSTPIPVGRSVHATSSPVSDKPIASIRASGRR